MISMPVLWCAVLILARFLLERILQVILDKTAFWWVENAEWTKETENMSTKGRGTAYSLFPARWGGHRRWSRHRSLAMHNMGRKWWNHIHRDPLAHLPVYMIRGSFKHSHVNLLEQEPRQAQAEQEPDHRQG